MLNIALFGPPGAGKGTQSRMIAEKYNLTYISTGDILRAEISNNTKLGIQAKDIINAGGLVSDEIIVEIIKGIINNNTDADGFLFDGFPRTTAQAVSLKDLLQDANTSLHCMLSLEVPTEELRRRLLARAEKENRADDTAEAIAVRLNEYNEKTAPVADFYKEMKTYVAIDGTGGVESIFDRLTTLIDSVMLKNA